jgi:glycerophosphoryl diester phosphodiesterase
MACPLLLGHRGARATRDVPENTLASFDLALAHGCDGFEFDLRRTADGEAVICHDPVWPGQASNLLGFRRGVPIASASRDELRELPRLEDVLRRYRASAFLDIELKVTGLANRLVSALSEIEGGPGLVVSSFLPEVLLEVARSDATLPLGLICETPAQLDAWRDLPVAYVIAQQRIATRPLVESLAALGKRVMVWTVNDDPAMRRFAEWGVAGIISDDTLLLTRTLKEECPP